MFNRGRRGGGGGKMFVDREKFQVSGSLYLTVNVIRKVTQPSHFRWWERLWLKAT
jgi:hypothetical protein